MQAIPLLIFISVFSFLVMRLSPGDPVAMYMNPERRTLTPTQITEIRRRLGLDRPIYVQYFAWLQHTVRGDWGYSLITKHPVRGEIASRLPNTLLLSGAALLLAILLAIPLGSISALKQYSIVDYIVTVGAFVGVSIPGFWLALVLLQIFSNMLGWLPAVGMHTLGYDMSGGKGVIDVAKHLVLPTITLSLLQIASWTRYQRSSLLDVLAQDYIRTARAKGLTERLVLARHALKNSLIPVVTLAGLSLPNIVNGAFIVETVFAWPGMGRLGVNSILGRDYPVVMAVTMLSSLLVVVGNLLADMAYVFVDPRIRHA